MQTLETLAGFNQRSNEEELMESPETSRQEFSQALGDIRWVNAHLGGIAAVRDSLIDMMPLEREGTVTILDLGTGSADIPMALVDWAHENKREVKIVAVDLHPGAVEAARDITKSYPEIQVVQGDALHLNYADQSFDFVISSMFMHHLTSHEAVQLLREMGRLCRRGVIVNDLERHPLAWFSIKLLGFAFAKGRIFKNDAPLSVLRGFQKSEVVTLCEQAGLETAEVVQRFPYRLLVKWQKPHAFAPNAV